MERFVVKPYWFLVSSYAESHGKQQIRGDNIAVVRYAFYTC